MTARSWRIGALARETGLTVRALHYYDSIGLVCPSGRTAGGHRIYHEADIGRLYAVVTLRRLGMSTAAIAAEFASHGAALDLPAVARRQRAEIDGELVALSALRNRVDEILAADGDPIELIAAMRALTVRPFAVGRALAMLPYDDVLDAQRRLVDMFEFEAGPIGRNADGTVAYASVLAGVGLVHLHPPTDQVRPPGPNGYASAIVVAEVADANRHAVRAARHGARLTYGPLSTSYGVREYGAKDHAGHHWSFQSPEYDAKESQ